ncbi:hypothetical protein NDA11_001425 [Ustilago hordei]|nr:hypothetical protein NDA11_001425 [Ustilago hordei]
MSKTPVSPPAVPGTPSARPRICKKLVIKGHASSSGASYTLFVKVQLPFSEHEMVYGLFKDPIVELQEAIVHRLDASGAAPALSASAATAASSLGIPLSIDHELNDSFIDFEHKPKDRSKVLAAPNDQSNLPRVIRDDNGNIMLKTFSKSSPRSKPSTSSIQASSSYMITLNLLVSSSSKPPLSPFSVRLAVPSCLNNFMRFTVDESIDKDLGSCGLAVEVDPPILPVSRHLKSPRRRPSSAASSRRAPSVVASLCDEEDVTLLGTASGDDSDLEQDDSAIVGPFQACEALVIRIAAPQAGDLFLPEPPVRTLSNALRAKKAISSISYQARVIQASERYVEEADDAQVEFRATIQLHQPFFPGLDREVMLYMQMDPSVDVLSWQPTAVDASRGISSWSFGSVASSLSSPNQLPRIASDGALSKSPSLDIGDVVMLPDPTQQAGDEEDLLSVAPPKGIDDNDFDFSLDNAAATPSKQRRFSLQSAGSAKPYPSQPPSEPSESSGSSANMLVVAFNLLPVLQSDEPVVITVCGTVTLSSGPEINVQDADPIKHHKGLIVPAALAHEYALPPFPVAAPSMTTPQPLEQPTESLEASLEASRETVQQQEYKHGLSTQSFKPTHDAPTDEILRQALAIIEAHNASLSDPSRNALVRQTPQALKEERGRNWILHMSHYLWTLFLAALVLMLFNAGQTANRELAAKLDELSRIVEASARTNAHQLMVISDHPIPSSTVVEATVPAVSRKPPDCSECDLRYKKELEKVADDYLSRSRKGTKIKKLDAPATLSSSASDKLHEEKLEHLQAHREEPIPRDVELESENLLPDESMEVRPSAEMGLTCFVSGWLQDLLRAPMLILQRLFGFLTGA